MTDLWFVDEKGISFGVEPKFDSVEVSTCETFGGCCCATQLSIDQVNEVIDTLTKWVADQKTKGH